MNLLLAIQRELRAPKGQYNKFGGFRYRSCEDILESVKPILEKYDAILTLTDDLILLGEWVFLKATATLKVGGETYTVSAFARIDKDKKGMDSAQLTGSASSYARKYALNGLFLIDDERDSDAQEPQTPPAGFGIRTAPPPPASATRHAAASMPTPPPPPPPCGRK